MVQLDRRALLSGVSAVVAAGLTPRQSFAATSGIKPPTPEGTYTLPEKGARSLDQGWRFHLGDIPSTKVLGHRDSYNNAKAGRARDAAAPDYDDSAWRTLDLPHDWAIELSPIKAENHSQGYRPRGYGWYRRAFRLDPSEKGRYLEIQFGAIATNATVWFNGNVVAHNWSGYNSIYIDATAMARYGSDLNSLVVRVDAEKMEGWWYEGAGIYRHTWLISRSPVHIVTDGVHANPVQAPDGAWRIPVEVSLYSIAETAKTVDLVVDLLDSDGAAIASARARTEVGALRHTTADISLESLAPRLWSIEEPNLYRVRTRLIAEGETIDERLTTTGFRTIRFDANDGFFLNGKHTKLQGVCIHQDHAGLGVAVPSSIVEWRVRRLKEMGCNAIRSSHNAPDVALLDACDRLGVLVMDENRLFNTSPDYVEQLRWLVRRDRNRPSVILWSVFNEEPIQGTATGYEMVRRMVEEVRALDTTRPVTAAMNGGMFAPVNVSQWSASTISTATTTASMRRTPPCR
jgi:beta-galactosidase